MMDSRVIHFIKKEFFQLMRDPRMLFLALMAPVIQLLAFGYIASTDIKNVSTAVLDRSRSGQSREYIRSIANSGYFNINYYVQSEDDFERLIDSGRVKVAIQIPTGFERDLLRGKETSVQAIIDGTNSSSATVILGYINQINFMNIKKYSNLEKFDILDPRIRVWYNPELKSVNYMVPAIFALLLMTESMILTAFSIVKEKEKGTIEQLIVTPLRPYELILGKLLPFVIVSIFDIAMVFLVATLWFKVPMRGSAILLFALAGLFLVTTLGLGVFISTISKTQRQALMSAMFVLIPGMILSGFVFPIANMPGIIQAVTCLIPVRYFLVIVRGIFLKGIGMKYLWIETWPLLIFGIIILTLSIVRFRKKID